MIKDIYKIDNTGVYVDIYKINTENNTYYNGSEWLNIDFDYTEIKPPIAKTVKLEDGEWIAVEEYPSEPQLPQLPSLEERLQIAENTILGLMDIMMGGNVK